LLDRLRQRLLVERQDPFEAPPVFPKRHRQLRCALPQKRRSRIGRSGGRRRGWRGSLGQTDAGRREGSQAERQRGDQNAHAHRIGRNGARSIPTLRLYRLKGQRADAAYTTTLEISRAERMPSTTTMPLSVTWWSFRS